MVPSDDFLEWLWPATRWVFDEVLYLDAFLARTAFITPTWEDFPVDESLEGDALVADYFAFVEEHSGTADWDWEIELVPRNAPSPAKILEGMAHDMTEDVKGGGVLVGAGDPLPIEYEPGLERDPELLVAVLSRGIAHWHCAGFEDPPGGEECFDYAVDLVWVLSGFGIFASNCAFRTRSQERDPMIGWGTQRFGALGQLELSYCMGLYAELLELDDRDAQKHLQPNPRAWLADARKDLRRRHESRLAELRAVGPALGPYRH